MNKYIVFAGEVYYPLQGVGDFKRSFFTLDDALMYIPFEKAHYDEATDWAHLVEYDGETFKTLYLWHDWGWIEVDDNPPSSFHLCEGLVMQYDREG